MRSGLLTFMCLPVAALAQNVPLEPGLTYRLYEIGRPMDHLAPLREDQTPNVDRRLDVLDLRNDSAFGGPDDFFFVEAFGFLRIEAAGTYAFGLTSDDGARLTIGESEVVNHDGVHPATTREGAIELDKGLHPFRVVMFENQGGAALTLSWKPPGANAFSIVPASAYLIEKGVTRVVSPGRKVILDGREHMKPGDGMPLDGVHPGWIVEDLRPDGFEPQVGGMDFLPDGRLVLSSFNPVNNGVLRTEPNGTIWVLDNVLEGDRESISASVLAEGFHDPSGIVVVDGDVYISHRPDITRLRDLNGDGVFETREVFVAPWIGDNYHHFSFGLAEHEGWIYGTLSTSIYFNNTLKADNVQERVVSMNGPNPPNRGTCYRVNIETREVEFLAGGFRTPNGIGLLNGEIFVSDNQGAWLPASKLVHVRPGRFYGHYNGEQKSDRYPGGGYPSLNSDQPVSPPVVWLPQNEICNSPGNPLAITDGPFAGQLYLAELTMGGIRRVYLEEVAGELQGAVFRFTQGLEGGVNRLIEGPDGFLYAGCTGSGGNWNWRNTRFGLQRLRPTGKTAFEYESIRATPDGFVVRLTEAVDRAWLEDPANYTIRQWRYEPTAQYGGPKVDVEKLGVTGVRARGREIHLSIQGLRVGSVVYFRMDPTSVGGQTMWSKEAWYTLNAIPLQ